MSSSAARPLRRGDQPPPPPAPAVSASIPYDFDESVRGTWAHDTRAGLVVFLVALPLCLGVALASGAPLFSGLITGIVGGLVVSRISGSQLMVSGPAAGLTAIVASAIIELGSYPAFLLAVVLGGVGQLLLAALRAGVLGYFFPSSVIKGMLAAIGLTILLKQLPYALGAGLPTDTVRVGGEGVGMVEAIIMAATDVHWGVLALTALSLAILFAWDHPALARAKRLMPAPLVVVGAGLLMAALLPRLSPALAVPSDALVQLPSLADGGWRAVLVAPDWSRLGDSAIWTVALTLTLVASLETLLSLEATDKLDPFKRTASANRELVAQGVGNSISGLLGGLPMTGVIVRSAANISAGGRTWRAAWFHGLFLVVAVAALTPLLNRIPLAALAAILVHTGWKLAHPSTFRSALRVGPTYYLPFVITVVAILATDLLVGIGIGIAVGAVFVLWNSYSHAYYLHREESADRHHVRLNLAEDVTFLNKVRINEALEALPSGAIVTVDGSRSKYIDHDVIEILHDFHERATTRQITFRLIGIPEPRLASDH